MLGLDDDTLVGAHAEMLIGSLGDLRARTPSSSTRPASGYLLPGQPLAGGQDVRDERPPGRGRRHLQGVADFQTFPIVYTRYSQAVSYAPQERRVLSFVLAKGEPGVPTEEVCDRIEERTGLLALSQHGFAWMTITYYLRRTGIPINFGITVLLGFIIGAAIAGQTFYLFTIDNLKQFGALKAMGVEQPPDRRHGPGAGSWWSASSATASAWGWRRSSTRSCMVAHQGHSARDRSWPGRSRSAPPSPWP